MISHTFPLRVRFAETDAMGIVHHARYFEYFEATRVALLDAIELPYAKIIEQGLHLPLVEAHARYRLPAKFDDHLEIEATLEPIEGVKIAISYKVRRQHELLAEGRTVHVFINQEGKAVRPPKDFITKLMGAR